MPAKLGLPSSCCRAQSSHGSWHVGVMLKDLAIPCMLQSLATCLKLPWSSRILHAMLACSLSGTAAGALPLLHRQRSVIINRPKIIILPGTIIHCIFIHKHY